MRARCRVKIVFVGCADFDLAEIPGRQFDIGFNMHQAVDFGSIGITAGLVSLRASGFNQNLQFLTDSLL